MPKSMPLSDSQREQAMTLLRGEFERLGQKALVAKRLGISRAAVSTLLSGTYGAGLDRMARRILVALDRLHCPYLDMEIERQHCAEINTGPAPTWNPPALSQRRACQTCPHKPKE